MNKSISSIRERVSTYQKNLIYMLKIERESLLNRLEIGGLSSIEQDTLVKLGAEIERVVEVNLKEPL